jgi:ATP-binding cassette subfamily B (MDR/TAP) protein 7
VAESGTHEKLIERGGLYSELWSAQETLFVEDDKTGEEKDGEQGKEKKK